MIDINKIMQNTSKGTTLSGWKGLDPKFRIEHEQTGAREYLAILKTGDKDAGLMSYSIRPGGILEQGAMTIFNDFKGQGHGRGMLAEIMKEGKRKGAITFRSDPAGLSDQMINTFQAGEREGIFQSFEERGSLAFKANLLKLDQAKEIAEASHLAPGRSKSLITGLAEGGVASKLRKLMTFFGSGWQGIGEEKSARDMFERVIGRNMDLEPESLEKLWSSISSQVESAESIKFLGGGQESSVLDIGNNKALKIGWGKLPPARYREVSEVLQPTMETHVSTEYTSWRGGVRAQIFPKVDTSDVTLSELYKMTDVMKEKGVEWEPHMGNIGKTASGEVKVIDVGIPIKSGTAEDREFEQLFGPFVAKPWEQHIETATKVDLPEMASFSERIMKSGEGSAIAKAGTSEVPAVLRATSRIIKNAL